MTAKQTDVNLLRRRSETELTRDVQEAKFIAEPV